MVEHLLDVQRVKGSSPLSSTKLLNWEVVIVFARIKEIDTKAVEVISQANKKACEIIERANKEKMDFVKQYDDMFLEKKKELYLKSKAETARIIDEVCAKYENLAKKMTEKEDMNRATWVNDILQLIIKR